MKHDHDARHLNIDAFARARASLAGTASLLQFDRLMVESNQLGGQNLVHFSATGTLRSDGSDLQHAWLALSAEVALPQICQRCLGSVDIALAFEREYRFVATEELAADEDQQSEEDVLVVSPDFNLLELIEDELLMALPAVPKHVVCPEPVKMHVADPDFADDTAKKPSPFAVLQRLKDKP